MAKVERSDVEDVLQLPRVGGIGADEGLQGWKRKEGRELLGWAPGVECQHAPA